MTMVTDVLTRAEIGPDLACGLADIAADPTGRADTLFRDERMAVRVRYATYWSGYLDALLMSTGEVQLTARRGDGAIRPTGSLECALYLDGAPLALRDGGTYWAAHVPLDRIAGLTVTVALRAAPPALVPAAAH